MDSPHQYIGLDVHKKWIWFCAKSIDGKILQEGQFEATKSDIAAWCAKQKSPWVGLMESTMFSHWIYDEMQTHSVELRVGHPAAMKGVLAAKNKSDRNDARRFADMCRCGSIKTIYVMPRHLRILRSKLRMRCLLKTQIVQLKNRMATLLMEHGVTYNARTLHSKRYYQTLLESSAIPEDLRSMVRTLRSLYVSLGEAQKAILKSLEKAPEIKDRVQRLQTIPGVGRILALTWALEVGDVARLPSRSQAMSFCGLVSAENKTAGKDKGGPLSKIRNSALQTTLIEVGHVAWRFYWKYDEIYKKVGQKQRSTNPAAIEVARKMVEYLMAVDRSGKDFIKQALPDGAEGTVAIVESQTSAAAAT